MVSREYAGLIGLFLAKRIFPPILKGGGTRASGGGLNKIFFRMVF